MTLENYLDNLELLLKSIRPIEENIMGKDWRSNIEKFQREAPANMSLLIKIVREYQHKSTDSNILYSCNKMFEGLK